MASRAGGLCDQLGLMTLGCEGEGNEGKEGKDGGGASMGGGGIERSFRGGGTGGASPGINRHAVQLLHEQLTKMAVYGDMIQSHLGENQSNDHRGDICAATTGPPLCKEQIDAKEFLFGQHENGLPRAVFAIEKPGRGAVDDRIDPIPAVVGFLADLLSLGVRGPLLIVAPNNDARDAWIAGAHTWVHPKNGGRPAFGHIITPDRRDFAGDAALIGFEQDPEFNDLWVVSVDEADALRQRLEDVNWKYVVTDTRGADVFRSSKWSLIQHPIDDQLADKTTYLLITDNVPSLSDLGAMAGYNGALTTGDFGGSGQMVAQWLRLFSDNLLKLEAYLPGDLSGGDATGDVPDDGGGGGWGGGGGGGGDKDDDEGGAADVLALLPLVVRATMPVVLRWLLPTGRSAVREADGRPAVLRGPRQFLNSYLRVRFQLDVSISQQLPAGSPLDVAVGAGDVDLCRLLLRFGARVNRPVAWDCDPPLFQAARMRNARMVTALATAGANVHHRVPYDNQAWADINPRVMEHARRLSKPGDSGVAFSMELENEMEHILNAALDTNETRNSTRSHAFRVEEGETGEMVGERAVLEVVEALIMAQPDPTAWHTFLLCCGAKNQLAAYNGSGIASVEALLAAVSNPALAALLLGAGAEAEGDAPAAARAGNRLLGNLRQAANDVAGAVTAVTRRKALRVNCLPAIYQRCYLERVYSFLVKPSFLSADSFPLVAAQLSRRATGLLQRCLRGEGALSSRRACSFCNDRQGTNRCSRCKSVYYCGAECQKAHWNLGHRRDCTRVA